MTDVSRPEVGQEAWVRERHYSRTTLFKGKITKVTPSLQVVVEKLDLSDRYGQGLKPDKLKAARETVQKLLEAIDASIELQTLPPKAETENEE